MSNLSVEEARAKLKNHFLGFKDEEYGKGWSDLWEKGDFLPWDRLAPSPALVETLREGRDVIGTAIIDVDGKTQRKKALVPGCGRGVDVLLLESFGYDAVGLEISQKAVEECEKYAEEHAGEYTVQDEKAGKGSRKFVHGDFYKDDWLEKAGMAGDSFDLIYDYTFFCAMQLEMRPAWAKRMTELLRHSPQANLICLEFPTTKPVAAGGPPFSSPPKAYMEHLSHPGEEVPYDTEGNIKLQPLKPSSPGALERVAHFNPNETHSIGKDANGKVVDFIGIWRH